MDIQNDINQNNLHRDNRKMLDGQIHDYNWEWTYLISVNFLRICEDL